MTFYIKQEQRQSLVLVNSINSFNLITNAFNLIDFQLGTRIPTAALQVIEVIQKDNKKKEKETRVN